MERLGERLGGRSAARLDTILRHLSPRLAAAPAPVSFCCGVGKGRQQRFVPPWVGAPLPPARRALPLASAPLWARGVSDRDTGLAGTHGAILPCVLVLEDSASWQPRVEYRGQYLTHPKASP